MEGMWDAPIFPGVGRRLLGLEAKVKEINLLREKVEKLPPEAAAEIRRLRKQIAQLEGQLGQDMNAWDHVQLARHPDRPYTLDYIQHLFENFREIHGDRKYADDRAIIGGMALFEGRPVMLIGHQKGRNTRERIHRNYGMPNPEGYRKAIRLMHLAEKFSRPTFTFVDTPGAYPGIGAEERGQAEAIAFNLRAMARIKSPIIVTVLGEGGSGGALAIGLGDRVLMLEHSFYSVISPESCSAILWKDQAHAQDAARALKLTAQNLLSLGVIDEVVPEPPGGAHNDPRKAAEMLAPRLLHHLHEVERSSVPERLEKRFQKFRKMGAFIESGV